MADETKTPSAGLDPTTDARIQMLYETAKKWANNEGVNASNITSFVLVLISSIEELITEPHAGGFKEKAVLQVLTMVLENEVVWESENTKQVVMGLVQTTVPLLIKTAIGVATGTIDLGKMFKNCSPCCFPPIAAEAALVSAH
jgi:hypothetical protein